MKLISIAVIAAAISLSGCAAPGPQPPPSKLDQVVFAIQTNIVNQTNTYQLTNVVTQVQAVTNTVGQVTSVTNVTQQVVPQYVAVPVTNYVYTPKPVITDGANMIGGMTGPYGAVAAAALAGILGIWGRLKSRQADTMQGVAENSTQALQTARAVIAALPNGASVADQFDKWLTAHQADADLASEIAGVLANVSSTHTIGVAAQGILAQVTTPLPAGPAKTS